MIHKDINKVYYMQQKLTQSQYVTIVTLIIQWMCFHIQIFFFFAWKENIH